MDPQAAVLLAGDAQAAEPDFGRAALDRVEENGDALGLESRVLDRSEGEGDLRRLARQGRQAQDEQDAKPKPCLLYTSPSPRD